MGYVAIKGGQDAMARADTGGLMCMGYSTMRGFAVAHGTIGELRVGEVPFAWWMRAAASGISERSRSLNARWWAERQTSERRKDLRIFPSATDCVSDSMKLRRSVWAWWRARCALPILRARPAARSSFVLYHTECIEGYGFTNHLKLPHYVTFQSQLDNLRKVVKAGEQKLQEVSPGGQMGEGEEEDDD